MMVETLRNDTMMAHLLNALERGDDIGHYGRLVFTMVARHFGSTDELVELLTQDKTCTEEAARSLITQVEDAGYNPPKRTKVLEFASRQDFPIVPNPDDPDCGNVYKDLQFPAAVYEHIAEYREAKVHAS